LTRKQQQFIRFVYELNRWAESQSDILAVALVGSYARNEERHDSDVDLVVIALEPKTYLQQTQWAQFFGPIEREQIENYGTVTSLRVWYSGGLEIEYGFTDETWAALPIDEGTKNVISDGMDILCERGSILSRLKAPIA
jgi:predicted nucleotidyltransferase